MSKERRDQLRALLNGAFDVGMAPLVLAYRAERELLNPVTSRRLINSYGTFLGFFPGFSGDFLRRSFYKKVLASCDPSVTISFGTTFSSDDIHIGAGTYLGSRCNLGRCRIGSGVLIGDFAMVIPGRHTHRFKENGELDLEQEHQEEPITIGDNCWIGAHSVVMADIGPRSTIGAGSVVVKPIPADSVAVGNPARVVRRRQPGG